MEAQPRLRRKSAFRTERAVDRYMRRLNYFLAAVADNADVDDVPQHPALPPCGYFSTLDFGENRGILFDISCTPVPKCVARTPPKKGKAEECKADPAVERRKVRQEVARKPRDVRRQKKKTVWAGYNERLKALVLHTLQIRLGIIAVVSSSVYIDEGICVTITPRSNHQGCRLNTIFTNEEEFLAELDSARRCLENFYGDS